RRSQTGTPGWRQTAPNTDRARPSPPRDTRREGPCRGRAYTGGTPTRGCSRASGGIAPPGCGSPGALPVHTTVLFVPVVPAERVPLLPTGQAVALLVATDMLDAVHHLGAGAQRTLADKQFAHIPRGIGRR